MNWSLIFKYFGVLVQVAVALEGVASQVAAKQPATTPPVNTYLGSDHVAISLQISPLP